MATQSFPYNPPEIAAPIPLPPPQNPNPYEFLELPSMPSASPPVPGLEYQAVMQPQPQQNPEAVLHVPTTDPQEIAARKEGWMQVINRVTSDPNLMRAVGLFGAQMLQGRQPGQTLGGQLGQAWMLGRTAYDFGKEAEFQRQLLLRREGRAEEAHGLEMRAGAARVRGLETDVDVKVATKEDAIAKVRQERQLVEQQLENAKNEGERKKIQLDWDKRIAEIKKAIPDAKFRKEFEASLESEGLKNLLTKAQIDASAATARAANARTAEQELENKDLESMTPEERRAYRAQAKAGQTSAQVQALEAYKRNWKVANPNATDQQAAAAADRFLTQAKGKGDAEVFFKWAGLYGTGDYAKDKRAYEAASGLTLEENITGGAATGKSAAPQKGARRTYQGKTYEFQGGDWRNQKNWKVVQ